MSKKIVIDKENIDSPIVRIFIDKMIKEGKAIEIDTDQSIEERAEKKYPDAIVTINLAKKMRYIEGATEQDLISKAREKELINLIGYHLSDSGFYMTKYVNGSVVWLNTEAKDGDKYEYTTEELFNQFTNR